MSGLVRMWLNVYQHRCPMAPSQLWVREMASDFAPRAGDQVHLWVNEYDDGEREDGISWTIHHHYWHHSGAYSVVLTKIVVDPDDTYIYTQNNYSRPWWLDRDGDLEPMLRSGGWLPYDEWKATGKVAL